MISRFWLFLTSCHSAKSLKPFKSVDMIRGRYRVHDRPAPLVTPLTSDHAIAPGLGDAEQPQVAVQLAPAVGLIAIDQRVAIAA